MIFSNFLENEPNIVKKHMFFTFKKKKPMANNGTFAPELNILMSYITDSMNVKLQDITSYIFIKAVIRTRNTTAYKAMERNMLTDGFSTLMEICDKNSASSTTDDRREFASIMKNLEEKHQNAGCADVLLKILESNETIMSALTLTGTTYEQIKISTSDLVSNSESTTSEKPVKHKKNENEAKKSRISVRKVEEKTQEKGDAERYLTNISTLAASGKVQHVFGNDEILKRIFTILSKRERNNVILVGEPGVGKTATAKHIANLIEEGMAPESFLGKKMLQMDFSSLLIGTAMRGGFETKMTAIINDAAKKGKYIFFVDDIHALFAPGSRVSDVPTESILENILSEKNIQFICTASSDGYAKYIQSSPYISRRLHKIQIDEKKEEDCELILDDIVNTLSSYHCVSYTEESVKAAVKYSSMYITERKLPDSAIDVLDEAGAKVSLDNKSNPEIEKLTKELDDIEFEKEEISQSNGTGNYDRFDELVKMEIDTKGKIAVLKKEMRRNKRPEISAEKIMEVISEKTGIPVNSLDNEEKERLKGLEERINAIVIGQENAVGKVCKAVRRKRCGIADIGKPAVFFFAGNSGCGKTYLAKTLAKELFGDDGKMVRLDMSEYAEKMSVTRLYGSSAGYVGYEDGGILTEAVKKNRRCVLLLDEIEKANDEVFNVFLQVFDDGRLTDNKGIVVDFKDTVIIMTSNIGSREILESGNPVGFLKGEAGYRDEEIVRNAIKKRFKPEFVNRIDEIVSFNRLGDNELRDIIKIEISKVDNRVSELGYSLSDDITHGKLVDVILEKVKGEGDFGARPVIREIQRLLEDGLTDYIIENNPEKGYCFKLDDIYHKQA